MTKMKTLIRKSFENDIKRFMRKEKNSKRVQHVLQGIDDIRGNFEREAANQGISQIDNVMKLRTGTEYYRVRIGDYRIGLKVSGNSIEFVRFLHRRDFYKHFAKG